MLSWEAANTHFLDFRVNPDLPHSRQAQQQLQIKRYLAILETLQLVPI